MKFLKTTILMVLCCASTSPIASGQETPVTLKEAREAGRQRFRLQKDKRAAAAKETQVSPKPNVAYFHNAVKPVLFESCLACHGPDRSEGRLRVDSLNPDVLTGSDVNRWREVYNVLSNSEMPPQDEPEFALADADRGSIVNWLSEELNKASVVRRSKKKHSSFRRLTKYEYSYALQDLLGLPWLPENRLPPETASADGFKNSSELLQMSAMQFEVYREIGLKALKRATVTGERPQPVTYIVSMQEQMQTAAASKKAKTFERNGEDYDRNRNRPHLLNRETGTCVQFASGKSTPQSDAVTGKIPEVSPVVMVLPRSGELKLNLDRFLPDEGVMHVRIRAGRSGTNPDEYASLRLGFSAHTSNNANFSNIISERDIPVTSSADDPQLIHFNISLGDIQRNPFRKLSTPFPRRDEFLHIRNESNARGKDALQVLIDYIEITAPFYEQWPPKSHTDIFADSDSKGDEAVYGREVLARFLRRVWRRPIVDPEVDQFMTLFQKYRPQFETMEEAMIEVLATALATPEFLYVAQRAADGSAESSDTISDVELASRLSLFLWCSIPDDELLHLAEQKMLRQPDVLHAQVERMLDDPRSRRFSLQFVEQWLGLDGLNSVAHVTDSSLKEAMREEPVALFNDMLRNNSSVMDFIHSDYAMVNERLAAHYRIPQVFGPHFRKVSIDRQANRGGLLTTAAVLTMNSDGRDSHPLKRGVWMLERFLHDPPPPPPPNVPEVDLTDPEILKMTVKERIADHRNKPACRSCHSRIDPWGIAFENYDALGAFRTRIGNKPVDATAELFNKQILGGMDGLKRYLLTERQDQFARAIVHKMTAYALGRPLSFGDHADIDSLTGQFRENGDRLKDLIHLIADSPVFRSK